MAFINGYAALAEQVRELMPSVYEDMKFIRDILQRHPLHSSAAATGA